MSPFGPLPWHGPAWEAFTSAREAGRVPHALLLWGPSGLGKGLLARRMAAALLCERGGGDPCGACAACRAVAEELHPDLALAVPEEAGRPITVDVVRSLAARLALASHGGGWRVAILAPAERMNTAAANALLKTLEEPGPDTLLLLVSDLPGRLPATVRSRCQRLRVPVPPRETALAWLAARARAPAETLEAALAAAHGAPLLAERLLTGEALAAREAVFEAWHAAGADPAAAGAAAADWDRTALERALGWLEGWVVDLARIGAGSEPDSADLAGRLRGLADGLDLARLHRFHDHVRRAQRLARESQAAPQPLWEAVMLAWHETRAG